MDILSEPTQEQLDIRHKYPDTYQIVEMLQYLKQQHNETNLALCSVGEGKRCSPFQFKKFTVEDIKKYINIVEGEYL